MNLTGNVFSTSSQLSSAQDSSRLVSMDVEDLSLVNEENALKAKLAELQAERQMYEDEQIHLSQGWATLFDREQRYYTEVPPTFAVETAACEQGCIALQSQVSAAELHLKELHSQMNELEPVLDEKRALVGELNTLRSRFEELEERRKACISRASLFFDLESKRVTEAEQNVHEIQDQLRILQLLEPLHSRTTIDTSANHSVGENAKMVKFAIEQNDKPNESSLDPLKHINISTSTMDISDSTDSRSGASHVPGQLSVGCQESFCIGLGDGDEECITGISGPSAVMVSLNQNSNNLPFTKRHRSETCSSC